MLMLTTTAGRVTSVNWALFGTACVDDHPAGIRDEIQALAHFLDLPQASAGHPASGEPASLPQSVEELERSQLAAALERSGWVKVRAARRLGITPRQLDYRMKKYRLQPPEEREQRRDE
jgi:Nif-specific regulatory protein